MNKFDLNNRVSVVLVVPKVLVLQLQKNF